ncbi:MAG: SUF system Fe-S cluster assembly regulator [Alphaproteobacteria bacterium]|nr:SUF system Fe-S cluster assembly regulator [Alphaproteobacteria bacterium]
MIKLGKLTDYAVAVMVQLSREGNTAARSAHQLAERTSIPEPTVAKVLKKLARKKLVESVRGAAGGYRLAASADEMSICDVIEALDGPITIVSCAGANDTCRAEPKCPAKGKWSPVNQAIRAALQAVRLSDMARSSSGCGHVPSLTQITEGGAHVNLK